MDWIEDETRTLHRWRYANTVKQYVVDSLDLARINPWDGEPPLILCESRSLEGVLRRLAGEYLCPIAPTSRLSTTNLSRQVQSGGVLDIEVEASTESPRDRPPSLDGGDLGSRTGT